MSVEIRVPQLGESVVEATVNRWLKQEGDSVAAGEDLVELETDKVNMSVAAEQAGVLERIVRHEGETVAINDVLGVVAEAGTAVQATATIARPAAIATPAAPNDGRAHPAATPVAQRLAAETGLDLNLVKGSGPGGKVTKEDVESHIGRGGQAVAPPPTVTRPLVETPSVSGTPTTQIERVGETSRAERPALPSLFPPDPDRREERVRMSRRRQAIALNLVRAQQTAAMLTTFNEVDMSAIMEVRKRRRDSFKERHGVGLGFMSFFTKAVLGALKAFPRLNAEIQGDEMVLKHYYDIGIAVGAEEGLVVPVVRNADRKTFAEIEREISELAGRAKENKMSLAELQGGTFTLTNGGVFGSLMSTPILNAPQVGILGMHKIQERPVAVNGEVVIRPMMYLALSYDHRIVDGSEAVRFLVRVKELIEDPETLLLEG